jgi:hypothetical protein
VAAIAPPDMSDGTAASWREPTLHSRRIRWSTGGTLLSFTKLVRCPIVRECDADFRQLTSEPQRQLFKEFLIFLSILSEIEMDETKRLCDAVAGQGAVREMVGIGRSAFSGDMKVSFQAARSIG